MLIQEVSFAVQMVRRFLALLLDRIANQVLQELQKLTDARPLRERGVAQIHQNLSLERSDQVRSDHAN